VSSSYNTSNWEILAIAASSSGSIFVRLALLLIGQNAQQLIHEKLIEKAKEYLSATPMSVSEIAFRLGFEYPQSFSKLFKRKTRQSPLEFRQ